MSVTFVRTGERRYCVRATPDGGEAASSMSAAMEPKERASFTAEQLVEIRQEFERLSERWSSLAVGESFTEPWRP